MFKELTSTAALQNKSLFFFFMLISYNNTHTISINHFITPFIFQKKQSTRTTRMGPINTIIIIIIIEIKDLLRNHEDFLFLLVQQQ